MRVLAEFEGGDLREAEVEHHRLLAAPPENFQKRYCIFQKKDTELSKYILHFQGKIRCVLLHEPEHLERTARSLFFSVGF